MLQIETWSRLPPAIRDHLVERMHDRNIPNRSNLQPYVIPKPRAVTSGARDLACSG